MPLKLNRTIHFIVPLLVLTTFCAAAGTGIAVKRIASGLDRPLYVTAPPGDTDRLFIVEQHTGRIKILNLGTGVVNETPFLDIDGLATGNEQGLLGLAFDPDYAVNGFFYVNFTQTNGTTNIRRYQVSASDPDIADPATGTTVMIYAQPFSNHNGGWLGFGPDGFLYISSGDGGSGNDPGNRAQDITAHFMGILCGFRPAVRLVGPCSSTVRGTMSVPVSFWIRREGRSASWCGSRAARRIR